jgi:DNA-binding Lrp family transcriptional regulator
MAKFEEVSYVSLTTGDFDILIHATFQSNEEVVAFKGQKMSKISGVREIRAHYVLKLFKQGNRIMPFDAQPQTS